MFAASQIFFRKYTDNTVQPEMTEDNSYMTINTDFYDSLEDIIHR